MSGPVSATCDTQPACATRTNSSLEKPVGASALRMRKSRLLRKKGQRAVWVAVHDREVVALVELGLLDSAQHNDSRAIGNAIGRLLDRIPVQIWGAAMRLRVIR